MTIDHTREYITGFAPVADPVDLTQAPPALFLLRWITHFCAPSFALLMGLSAWLSQPSPSRLILRGLSLLLIELTLINWGWTFNPLWPRYFFQVIAALGFGMIALGLVRSLSPRAVLLTGAAILLLHNAFDWVRFPPTSSAHYLWSVLHQKNVLPLFAGFEIRTTYPVLPVIALAFCGYGIAPWFRQLDAPALRNRLLQLGAALTALFLLLRLTNAYGDTSQFTIQPTLTYTLLSLLNTTKYPISLQFALMTLGPLFLLWSQIHARRLPLTSWLRTLGAVPMFYYVAHIYLIHILALLAALAAGFTITPATFATRFGGIPAGFAFPLWTTLPASALVVALLYPACLWYRRRHRRPASPPSRA